MVAQECALPRYKVGIRISTRGSVSLLKPIVLRPHFFPRSFSAPGLEANVHSEVCQPFDRREPHG